jgi:hypothetical protein
VCSRRGCAQFSTKQSCPTTQPVFKVGSCRRCLLEPKHQNNPSRASRRFTARPSHWLVFLQALPLGTARKQPTLYQTPPPPHIQNVFECGGPISEMRPKLSERAELRGRRSVATLRPNPPRTYRRRPTIIQRRTESNVRAQMVRNLLVVVHIIGHVISRSVRAERPGPVASGWSWHGCHCSRLKAWKLKNKVLKTRYMLLQAIYHPP